MFEDANIDKYAYEEIPLDRDCLLMSEIYIEEFDNALSRMILGENCSPSAVGCVSFVAIRKINKQSLELSWYPNISTRFHELLVNLPKDKIKMCVGCWQYDIKPYIFVDHEWLENLNLREYSVFGFIDAIGMKETIRDNLLTKENLLDLRYEMDLLAERYRNISFISFSDSLLLKSNWAPGYHEKGVKCSYDPEIFFTIIQELEKIYIKTLGLKIYAILTQGNNEYYEDSLLHISNSKNHICLNSLGTPFAELMAIDSAVKVALKSGIHSPMQVYMDEEFYHSLHLKYEYKKNEKPRNGYRAIMKPHQSYYYYASCATLVENLEPKDDEDN